ncbi:MAG: RluA family pseudouridine synthase [Acidobacteria bacterium]|nr:RluA family pseudouridine synthase [Acidobacteriota bacterium]
MSHQQEKAKIKQEKIETIRLSSKLTVPIIYEDRHLIAISKPSGYLVAPVQWEQTSRNLMLMLREGIDMGAPWARRRVLRFIANIHRLDADTSGVLLLAKNRAALSQMTDRFERRQVEKIYLALVKGQIEEDNFSVDIPIAEHPKTIGLMTVDKRNGREALTYFSVIKRFAEYTLLKAMPITGRTHQIRVHLAWIGLPVLNDPLYGKENKPKILKDQKNTQENSQESSQENTLPIERLALHSSELIFKHPLLPKKVRIEAPLPKDFAQTLQRLEKTIKPDSSPTNS